MNPYFITPSFILSMYRFCRFHITCSYNAPHQRRGEAASGCMRLLGGFAWWFPCVWRPFIELREIIIYFMPLSLGAYEDM